MGQQCTMDQTEGNKKKGAEVEEAKGKFHFLPINVIVTAQVSTWNQDQFCHFSYRKCSSKNIKCITHRSGLASIFAKKSSPTGFKELINLFATTSVSTLKYCVYDEMLKNPCQLLAGCCPKASAWMNKPRIREWLI